MDGGGFVVGGMSFPCDGWGSGVLTEAGGDWGGAGGSKWVRCMWGHNGGWVVVKVEESFPR